LVAISIGDGQVRKTMNNRSMLASLVLSLGAATLASSLGAGCGEGDLTVRGAAPPTTATGGSGGAAGASGAGGETSGPVVRQVFRRKPFGETNPENTLWDGDFEWSGAFVSQYPWLSISGFGGGFEAPGVKVSGQCYSGLKCGTLTSSRSAAGIAVSPATEQTRVRVYAKPGANETCDVVSVQYVSCFEGFNDEDDIPATSEKASVDDRGYCVYEADVPTRTTTPCIFLSYDGDEDEIFFDAAFVGAPPTGPEERRRSRPLAARLPGVPTARAVARLDRMHTVLRAFRDTPPPPPVEPPAKLPSRMLARLAALSDENGRVFRQGALVLKLTRVPSAQARASRSVAASKAPASTPSQLSARAAKRPSSSTRKTSPARVATASAPPDSGTSKPRVPTEGSAGAPSTGGRRG
jgi:hypothetical protein